KCALVVHRIHRLTCSAGSHQRCPPRTVCRISAAALVFRRQLEMRTEFILQIRVAAAGTDAGGKSDDPFAK
nr:hypothetical protein [Acidobacteriota bacterium]